MNVKVKSFGIALLVAGAAALLLWSAHHEGAGTSAQTSPGVVAGHGSRPEGAPAAPTPKPNRVQSPPSEAPARSVTQPQESAGRLPEGMEWQDEELARASAVEHSGDMGRLFFRWEQEETDEARTDELLERLGERLVKEQIRPSAASLRCAESLCRAHFEFDGLDELTKLGRLETPDGARRISGPVERSDGQYRVVVYWPNQSAQNIPAEVAAVFALRE